MVPIRELLVAATGLILSTAAFARPPVWGGHGGGGIDSRGFSQELRIQQGAASGDLTAREAAKLERGQNHVNRVEQRIGADGVVTTREGARLDHAEDVQSRRIYRESNDRQHDYNLDGRQDKPLKARGRSR